MPAFCYPHEVFVYILVKMENKWDELKCKLNKVCLKTVQEFGFETMTPVQVRLIKLYNSKVYITSGSMQYKVTCEMNLTVELPRSNLYEFVL